MDWRLAGEGWSIREGGTATLVKLLALSISLLSTSANRNKDLECAGIGITATTLWGVLEAV